MQVGREEQMTCLNIHGTECVIDKKRTGFSLSLSGRNVESVKVYIPHVYCLTSITNDVSCRGITKVIP